MAMLRARARAALMLLLCGTRLFSAEALTLFGGCVTNNLITHHATWPRRAVAVACSSSRSEGDDKEEEEEEGEEGSSWNPTEEWRNMKLEALCDEEDPALQDPDVWAAELKVLDARIQKENALQMLAEAKAEKAKLQEKRELLDLGTRSSHLFRSRDLEDLRAALLPTLLFTPTDVAGSTLSPPQSAAAPWASRFSCVPT